MGHDQEHQKRPAHCGPSRYKTYTFDEQRYHKMMDYYFDVPLHHQYIINISYQRIYLLFFHPSMYGIKYISKTTHSWQCYYE